MASLDFLFEGKPPQSVTTYGQTVENMPKWLSDYTQGVIGKANAIAAEPYQTYGGPRLAGFTPDQLRAFELTRSGAGKASSMIQGAASLPGAFDTAAPYVASAARTTPGAIQEYMNPYVENVINRAGTLANRALTERFLPALESRFGSAGHDARSSAYRRAADQGVRDITEGLHEQAQAALAGAYDTAGQQFATDANRMGILGQLVGQLRGQDATVTADLAKTLQSAGLTDAAALETIGRQQQGLDQSSLDLAYQDFQNQRNFPRDTIDWMSSIVRGLPSPRQVTTTQTGPAEAVGPSPLGEIASLATGVAGLLKTLKNKRGGAVRVGRRYARGGAITQYGKKSTRR